MDGWIDLVEYSAKYGISQSTLRRRIRAQALAYKMERGKYMLQDSSDAMKDAPLFARQIHYGAPRQTIKAQLPVDLSPLKAEIEKAHLENRKLKAQIAELETLVGVLEAELQSR